MHMVWMLAVGMATGALAKRMKPAADPGNVGISMAVGGAGAVLAGMLAPGLLPSIVGAQVLLAVYRFAAGPRDALA